MPENQFLTYQKFTDESEAKELSDLLTKSNIEFLYEDNYTSIDTTFTNSELNKEYRVKLKKQDFEKADSMLLNIAEQQLDTIDPDYYLFGFTNQELIDILIKSDEWGKLDYLLAQKILKDRGQEVTTTSLESLREKRMDELGKPEDSPKAWIIAGYILCISGGYVALFIGWHIVSFKKILPNGDQVNGYSLEDRKHGKRILILGMVSLILWTMLIVFIRY